MSVHEIVKNPDARLRAPVKDVPADRITTPAFQRLLDDMVLTMHEANGIGLAATQIGRDDNIAIVTMSAGPVPLINLKIESYGKNSAELEEGCLSVPGIWGKVRRALSVRAYAQTRDGRRVTLNAKGLLAHIIQHEFDHLHGTLFIDKAEKTWKLDKKSTA